jgi:group II intron reverse transcriptase/maturase
MRSLVTRPAIPVKAKQGSGEVGGLHSSQELPESIKGSEPREAAYCRALKRSEGRGDGSDGLATPAKVRKLQIVLYRKAKAEKKYRFWSLYGELCRWDVLEAAWGIVQANGGAAGVDGQSIEEIAVDVGLKRQWIGSLQEELRNKTYRPSPVRRVWIPKASGGKRPLGIPTVKDRVVQTAAALILTPIFEADFHEHSYGYRPRRNTHQAMDQIRYALWDGLEQVVDADIAKYFETIPHRQLIKLLARRISDGAILKLVRSWLRAPVQEEGSDGKRRVLPNKQGTPQGGVISPLLANLYLNRLDHAVNRIRRNKCRMVRYADDLVILCKKGMAEELQGRLARWLGANGLRLNAEKTRLLDIRQESLVFLGFRVSWRKSGKTGRFYPHVEPSRQSIAQYRRAVRAILNRTTRHMPSEQVIWKLNQISRGWAQAFHYENCTRVFRRLADYTRQKLRSWLWRKHGKRRGRYDSYTYQRLHETYGLWRWPERAGWTTGSQATR